MRQPKLKHSIARRLGLSLAALLAALGLLLVQGTLWLLDGELRRQMQLSLQDDASYLLAALMRGQQGVLLDEQRLSEAWQRPFSGQYFQVDFAGQHFRSRSLWDFELSQGSSGSLESVAGPQNQALLLLCTDKRRFRQRVHICVARDFAPARQALRRFQWVVLAAGSSALLLILLLQRLLLRRALKPLDAAREQILQLEQGRRSTLDSRVPLELLPLVEQINRLLAHTESTLRRSRNALGNLGHALKTPLAVLRSLAESRELSPALREKYAQQLGLMEQRIGRELGRARLAGEALPGAHFSCGEELPALFATLRMIHGDKLNMHWQAPAQLTLPLDREDLLELLGNLLDNACKWGRAEVRLRIELTREVIVFVVDDDGAGVSAAQRGEILARGSRLDEQTSGHGLGLAIASDIVESWLGRLELQESPLGGLRVRVELPL